MEKTSLQVVSQDVTTLAATYLSAPVALCLVDHERRCLAANERFAATMNRPLAGLLDEDLGLLLPGADAFIATAFEKARDGEAFSDYELPVSACGRVLLASAEPFRTNGELAGLSIGLVDITERKRMAETLIEMEQRIAFAMESANQWIWELDIPANRVRRSPHWKSGLGYAQDEAVSDSEHVAWSVVHPDDRPQVLRRFRDLVEGRTDLFEAVYRVQHRNGNWIWIMGRGRIVERAPDGKPLRLLATSVDISRQKRIEQELGATVRQREDLERELVAANRRLTALSEMDSLTELPNRRKFDEVLSREIRRNGRHTPALALLMIDVDHFKSYNDLYGHPEGDECLRRVAETLRRCARRAGDVITRYGGEEFAAILADTNEADATLLAGRMLEAVRALRIAHAGSSPGIVTVSIGVAVYELSEPAPRPMPPATLIEAADRALYSAKQAGRNCIAASNIDASGALRTMAVTENGTAASARPVDADKDARR
ncbi:GGDEF domain-containing protein [Ancylobacter mangrovi]|uniref:GGDEF domain-containing protein n=1 Tax=Ancylobacter mangrovi TaxID=2972472 RepID=UPI00216161E9|nr:sensor domain-containing diguanylate cyclase [Ancylobacter mangrovi]MCS0501119.1 diguanylate cyclase [Ancylobacter mangrovi]